MSQVQIKAAFTALTAADITTLNTLTSAAVNADKFRDDDVWCAVRLVVNMTPSDPLLSHDVDLGHTDAFDLAFKPEFMGTNAGKVEKKINEDVVVTLRKNNPEIARVLALLGDANNTKVTGARPVVQVQFIMQHYSIVINEPNIYAHHKSGSGQGVADKNATEVTINVNKTKNEILRGTFLATDTAIVIVGPTANASATYVQAFGDVPTIN